MILYFRTVCECILCHEKLQYQEADFWVESFHLIRKIIGGVDYKGVREIMKVILKFINLCSLLVKIICIHIYEINSLLN